MSEEMVKEPIPRLVNFASAGVEPNYGNWTVKAIQSIETSWFIYQ
jgi:hypothetical protein